MLNKPRVVSLFAGIGGFDLGLERAGFEVVRQVEIDAYCLKVLEKHWPHVDRGTDVRKEESEAYAERYGAINLVCGGFPCEDLSLAGKRAGLAGERSGLFFELARIADAVPSAWVLAENVPGLLSSAGGADFATVLGELSGFFPEVPADGWRNSGVCSGPKGTVAWRVLDAQYFGVAQRRRRVFIVRSPATARGSAFEVLFESESVSGNPPPSREKGQGIAAGISHSLKASGGFKQDSTHETYVVAATLRSGGNQSQPAHSGYGVRRLTPTEAERLQGFPDGWTLLGDKTPDSPRYKACGNAVCVNVAEWIGRRLISVMTKMG